MYKSYKFTGHWVLNMFCFLKKLTSTIIYWKQTLDRQLSLTTEQQLSCNIGSLPNHPTMTLNLLHSGQQLSNITYFKIINKHAQHNSIYGTFYMILWIILKTTSTSTYFVPYNTINIMQLLIPPQSIKMARTLLHITNNSQYYVHFKQWTQYMNHTTLWGHYVLYTFLLIFWNQQYIGNIRPTPNNNSCNCWSPPSI